MNKTGNKELRKWDIIWSYMGQIVNYGVHILLTPVISVKLSSYELGLWYTFTSIFTLINFFDTGFSPLLMRNAAYCMGGARELLKEGIITNEREKEAGCNYGLLKTLYKTARKLYGTMAAVFFALLILVGIPYIKYITQSYFRTEYIAAWVIYSFGIALNVFMIFLPAFLKGVGSIAEVQRSYAIGRGLQLIFSIAGVFAGYGIMALACGFVLGNALICIMTYVHYYRHWRRDVMEASGEMTQKKVLGVLWFNARKLGLVAVGRYMSTQGNILICSTFLSLEVSACYGLTVQALQAISSIAMIYLQAVVPSISSAKVEKNREKEKTLFSAAVAVFWCTFGLAAPALLFLANPLLAWIGANTRLLELPALALAAAGFFLQYNQICFSLYIGMGNEVPYMKGEFFSGAAVMLCSFLLATCTQAGILGIVAVQGLVQACYNDWKWPLSVCRRLQLSLGDIGRIGMRSIGEKLRGALR